MDGLSARGATFEAVLAAVFRRAPGEDISVSTACYTTRQTTYTSHQPTSQKRCKIDLVTTHFET